MAITFRPGLLPNDWRKRRIYLSPHIDAATVLAAPPAADWDTKVSAWEMLGNDTAGDCDPVAQDHSVMAWTANAGTPVVPTTADALRAYSEITGYDPSKTQPDGSNPTDNGTVMQDGLDYWRKTGMPVGAGRHQILAFAQVDHTSPLEMRAAVALFGEILLGVQIPQSAMDQTEAGQPWDYVPGSPILGGHAICCGRYDANAGTWTVITWGQEQIVTEAFMTQFLGEAWVAVSQEWFEANGNTPSGLNLATLGQDFTALTGQPAPWAGQKPPAPTPPSPHHHRHNWFGEVLGEWLTDVEASDPTLAVLAERLKDLL